jgi:two-component system response regulator DesR
MAEPAAVAATRILVAEDVEIYRHTLVAVLELEEDLQVVAELASGDRIVPVALDRSPDVAVLDIDLPGVDGLTAAAALRDRLPACRVLMLTGLAVGGVEARARACGAAGFLSKAMSAGDIVAAVRRVARGELVFDADGRTTS